MYLPAIFGENILDDWFDFPTVRSMNKAERKLYGKNTDRLMSTDVHELEDRYDLDIDLPGFGKDDISVELNNGYLTVSASKSVNEEEQNDKGRLIRQERYSGSMQRSFYVGRAVTEDDVKAGFSQGVLKLSIPKLDASRASGKTIAIEG